jgi:hypothetical protein
MTPIINKPRKRYIPSGLAMKRNIASNTAAMEFTI